jgi:hypothetical protein
MAASRGSLAVHSTTASGALGSCSGRGGGGGGARAPPASASGLKACGAAAGRGAGRVAWEEEKAAPL